MYISPLVIAASVSTLIILYVFSLGGFFNANQGRVERTVAFIMLLVSILFTPVHLYFFANHKKVDVYNKVIAECQSELPRNEYCEIIAVHKINEIN